MKNETILRQRAALEARLGELDVLGALGSRRPGRAGTVPADSVPRTESGVAIDELTRLRETVDLGLAEIDQTYFEANKIKIGRRVELEIAEAKRKAGDAPLDLSGVPESMRPALSSQKTFEEKRGELTRQERVAQVEAEIEALKEKHAALLAGAEDQ